MTPKDVRPVPKRRDTCIYELVILSPETGRFKVYLSIGRDAAGRPVEIWLDCAKEGTMLREFMHAYAALFSIALQNGVPLARLVKLYREWRFEPCGAVDGFPPVPECQSVLSLVVRVLEAEFPEEKAAPPAQGDLFEEKR